jgi:hypothetical protein
MPIIIRAVRRIFSSFEIKGLLEHTRTTDKIPERQLLITQRALRAPRGKSILHCSFLQCAAFAGCA